METTNILSILLGAFATILLAGVGVAVAWLKSVQKRIEDAKEEVKATHETVKHNCALQEQRHQENDKKIQELVDAFIVKKVETRLKIGE